MPEGHLLNFYPPTPINFFPPTPTKVNLHGVHSMKLETGRGHLHLKLGHDVRGHITIVAVDTETGKETTMAYVSKSGRLCLPKLPEISANVRKSANGRWEVYNN
jgi:hypothetical protein